MLSSLFVFACFFFAFSQRAHYQFSHLASCYLRIWAYIFMFFSSPSFVHNIVLLCMRGHRKTIVNSGLLVWCLFAFWMVLSLQLFIIICFHSSAFLSVDTQRPSLYTPVSEIYIHCPLIIIIIKRREDILLYCVSCAFISSLEGLFGSSVADGVLEPSDLRQKVAFILQWYRLYIPHLAD